MQQRTAEAAEGDAPLQTCGQALSEQCVADAIFRKLGKEEDRWGARADPRRAARHLGAG